MRISYPKTDHLLRSLLQRASFKCETPQLELKSLRSFLAIKRCQRTKSKKVIKQSRSSLKDWRIYAPIAVKLLTRSLTRRHATTYPPPAYAYRRQQGHASCAQYSACASSHCRHRAGWREALWVGLEVRCEMEVRWAHKPRSVRYVLILKNLKMWGRAPWSPCLHEEHGT